MFKDMLFPIDVAVQTTGGPSFDVDVIIKSNQQEARNLNSAFERWSGDCSQGAKLPKQYKPLQAFFRNARAMAYSWRYRDPLDYTVAAADSAFIVIDSTHAYLGKNYVYQGQTFTRKITKPVNGTFSATGGSGLSLDYDTGILTHGSLPTSFVTEFHIHARFDTNAMTARSVAKNPTYGLIVDWNDIPIVEVINEED